MSFQISLYDKLTQKAIDEYNEAKKIVLNLTEDSTESELYLACTNFEHCKDFLDSLGGYHNEIAQEDYDGAESLDYDEFFSQAIEQEINRKKASTKALFDVLKSTGDYNEVKSLKYVRGEEALPYTEAVIVELPWKNAKINVGMDSCSALVKDVVLKIDSAIEED